MESEQETIQKAQAGDDRAFETLVQTHMQAVYSFTYRYAGSKELAEDATQEAFVKAWKNLKGFDLEKPFKPWLFAIARNVVLDYLRKRSPLTFTALTKSEGETSFEETLADPEPLPDEVFARKNLGEEVQKAVAGLTPRDRAVVSLRYEESLPFEAISEILQAPVNTVKSWHRRALTRLKKALESPGAPKHHE